MSRYHAKVLSSANGTLTCKVIEGRKIRSHGSMTEVAMRDKVRPPNLHLKETQKLGIIHMERKFVNLEFSNAQAVAWSLGYGR
jgi:hypothetical protein